VASAKRLYRSDPPHRREGWWLFQNVVHELLDRPKPYLRGEYLELVPYERLRYTDKFDDPNLPGEMQTTVTLSEVSCGTELNVVQEGIPEAIPTEACYLGWQESLILLAKLVEAEISG
jgi:uncharacterized protein YndB with AHSA1/START domain